MSSYSLTHFVPNLVPIATRVSRGKIRLAALAYTRKRPYRRKHLADISYTRVIANFVPNFVAVRSVGEMRVATFNGPSPKTPYRHKNLADIFYTDRV